MFIICSFRFLFFPWKKKRFQNFISSQNVYQMRTSNLFYFIWAVKKGSYFRFQNIFNSTQAIGWLLTDEFWVEQWFDNIIRRCQHQDWRLLLHCRWTCILAIVWIGKLSYVCGIYFLSMQFNYIKFLKLKTDAITFNSKKRRFDPQYFLKLFNSMRWNAFHKLRTCVLS